VRKKQRTKRIIMDDLINKGATAQMAQSYVINLDSEDLTRIHKNQKLSDLNQSGEGAVDDNVTMSKF